MQRIDVGTPFLRLEHEGHLAWLTIDRPKSRNAFSTSMYFGIKKSVRYVNGLDQPTALIVTGVDDVFAPGGELRGRVEDPNPVVDELGSTDILPFEAIRHSIAPVVSAVNGICQAGGLLVAMLSDVAVVSEQATFRVPEVLRGIADTPYAAYLLGQVGVANARDLMLTGRRLDASEALRLGMVTRVVPHEQLRAQAQEVAEDILRTPPQTRMQIKRLLNERAYGYTDYMNFEWSLSRGDEVREGFQAFAEKRSPEWVPQDLRRGRL